MSKYLEYYKKMSDGYDKIVATINSVRNSDQLNCIPVMIESWVYLLDKYNDQIYDDKTDRNRKRNSFDFIHSGEGMLNDVKNIYQQRMEDFVPYEYEGSFHPVRIRGLQEINEINKMETDA